MTNGLTNDEIDAISAFIDKIDNIEYPYPIGTKLHIENICINFLGGPYKRLAEINNDPSLKSNVCKCGIAGIKCDCNGR